MCKCVHGIFHSVFSFSWSILESEAGSKTNFEPATNKCQIDALLEKEQQQQQQHTQFAKTSSKRLTTSIGRITGLISSSNTGQIWAQMQLLPPETNLQNCISKVEQSGMLCLFQSAQEREEIMTRSGKGFPERDTYRNREVHTRS
jgi:hypothetical protein